MGNAGSLSSFTTGITAILSLEILGRSLIYYVITLSFCCSLFFLHSSSTSQPESISKAEVHILVTAELCWPALVSPLCRRGSTSRPVSASSVTANTRKHRDWHRYSTLISSLSKLESSKQQLRSWEQILFCYGLPVAEGGCATKCSFCMGWLEESVALKQNLSVICRDSLGKGLSAQGVETLK